ncbi:MAG: hypothetical protein WBZ19_05265 [Chthoniobacterales bacterium]
MHCKSVTILCVCIVVALSACTTTETGQTSYDHAAGTTIVTGRQTTIAPLAGAVRTIFLKAEMAPGDTELYLVVLYLSTKGWLSADQVWDASGEKLRGFMGQNETIPIQYGQVTKEIYYIPLTRRYLEKHRKSGIQVRLKGPNGTLVATQLPTFVSGFLAAVDAVNAKPSGEVIVKKLAQAH